MRSSFRLFLIAAACCACNSAPETLDAVGKAARTNELRKEADACYSDYMQSEFTDLAALECFTEKHRLTTELHPSPQMCSICYYNYGKGLHILGVYYCDKRDQITSELADADARTAAELQSQIRQLTEKIHHYFSLSNEQLEAFFSANQYTLPDAFWWASQHSAELGDFAKADHYAGRLLREVKLNDEDKAKVERLRKQWSRLAQRQRDENLRDSLEERAR